MHWLCGSIKVEPKISTYFIDESQQIKAMDRSPVAENETRSSPAIVVNDLQRLR